MLNITTALPFPPEELGWPPTAIPDDPLTKRLLRNDNEEISETVIDFKIPNKSKDFDKKIRELRREMEKSAKELDFKSAALYRDQIKKLKEIKSISF